jgi:hypothetical protein
VADTPYTHGEDPRPRNRLQKVIDAIVTKLAALLGKKL